MNCDDSTSSLILTADRLDGIKDENTDHMEEIIPEIEPIMLISNGEIITDGSKTDILTSKYLGNLYRLEEKSGKRMVMFGKGDALASGEWRVASGEWRTEYFRLRRVQ
ncbi:MAG: hypothetical protein OIF55_07275 [Amphritea sp.]|nr:hypothetical protein [Amphritea sp.]